MWNIIYLIQFLYIFAVSGFKLKFDEIQNYYLTQTLVLFVGGVELKKKQIPASENWNNSFILKEYKDAFTLMHVYTLSTISLTHTILMRTVQ